MAGVEDKKVEKEEDYKPKSPEDLKVSNGLVDSIINQLIFILWQIRNAKLWDDNSWQGAYTGPSVSLVEAGKLIKGLGTTDMSSGFVLPAVTRETLVEFQKSAQRKLDSVLELLRYLEKSEKDTPSLPTYKKVLSLLTEVRNCPLVVSREVVMPSATEKA